MLSFLKRLRALRHVTYEGSGSLLIADKSVEFILGKGSKIILKDARVSLGRHLKLSAPYSSKPKTTIILGEQASLVFEGDVQIAPGVSIRVGDHASLMFGGKNMVAHDCMLLCNYQMNIGEGACLSWNVNLIDDDGHRFKSGDGQTIRTFRRPLNIGKNVGIQMNVSIPRGLAIGENCVVSANTVLRQDLLKNSLAYSDYEVKVKNGITSGLQEQVRI